MRLFRLAALLWNYSRVRHRVLLLCRGYGGFTGVQRPSVSYLWWAAKPSPKRKAIPAFVRVRPSSATQVYLASAEGQSRIRQMTKMGVWRDGACHQLDT